MTNDELCHYGVLGMKWGKRKAQGDNALQQTIQKKQQAVKTAKNNYDNDYKDYMKKTHGGLTAKPTDIKALSKSMENVNYAKKRIE